MLSPDTSVPANDLETPMNDVLTLLLSISEDPTVDFTYRLSALKAMGQLGDQVSTDCCETRGSVDAPATLVPLVQPAWSFPGRLRFSAN